MLTEFLTRFNQRFGVSAAQPESAYRPVDRELDLGSVLCIKELRRVAKDNTVQYHGRSLQLFPSMERPSYAGARVEVQERLDGRLLVRHREQILTPQEAPPLATELRARVVAGPVMATPPDPDPTDWRPQERVRAPVTRPSGAAILASAAAPAPAVLYSQRQRGRSSRAGNNSNQISCARGR